MGLHDLHLFFLKIGLRIVHIVNHHQTNIWDNIVHFLQASYANPG